MSSGVKVSPELAGRIAAAATECEAKQLITHEQFLALTDGRISSDDKRIAQNLYSWAFSTSINPELNNPKASAEERQLAKASVDVAYRLWTATSEPDTRGVLAKGADFVSDVGELASVKIGFTIVYLQNLAMGAVGALSK